ncbi:hypothetical protein [Pyruvatibacter sp.]|uniref:hypothetical protein n=1 Tax=Pyruvatibacter sp. TaxID=1981328 RepID=UPI0032EEFD20
MPLAHVAAAFGRDRSTASHACKVVEWQRDNPAFDHFLTRLEWHLLAASGNAAQADASSLMTGEGA